MHLNLVAICQFLPHLRGEQFFSIRNDLSKTIFESDHFSQQHVDKVNGWQVLEERDEHFTLPKSVDHSHNSMMTSRDLW